MRFSLRKIPGIEIWVLYEDGRKTKWSILRRSSFNNPLCSWWVLREGNRMRGSFQTRDECYSRLRELCLEKKADLILGD